MNSDIREDFIGPNYSWTFSYNCQHLFNKLQCYYAQEAIIPTWAVVHLQQFILSTENVIREGKEIQF
jgi:hypothetical protein